MKINKVIHGDCLEVMKTFPDNSVNCILTDTPNKEEISEEEHQKRLRKLKEIGLIK